MRAFTVWCVVAASPLLRQPGVCAGEPDAFIQDSVAPSQVIARRALGSSPQRKN